MVTIKYKAPHISIMQVIKLTYENNVTSDVGFI